MQITIIQIPSIAPTIVITKTATVADCGESTVPFSGAELVITVNIALCVAIVIADVMGWLFIVAKSTWQVEFVTSAAFVA